MVYLTSPLLMNICFVPVILLFENSTAIHSFSICQMCVGVFLRYQEVGLLLLLLLSHFSRVRLLGPHRRQPTRLPHPWDSPGKNTGVSCHFLLQCMKVTSESEVVQSCPTLRDPMDCRLPGSSAHGIFQTRVLEWVAIAFSASRS